MAATAKWSERRGATQELTPDGKIVWTSEWTFQVTDAPTEADAVAQVPFALGDDHPVYGSELKVNILDPQQRGPTGYWEVRVGWSSRVAGAGSNVNQNARINWAEDVVVEQVDRDYDGHPLFNSVGDPPVTPLTNEFYDLVFSYTQWEPEFNVRRSVRYRNSVNADDFRISFGGGVFNGSGTGFGGADALTIYSGEAKMTSYRPAGEYEANQALVQVYYEIRIRERIQIEDELWASGWDWRFLDSGNRGLYSDSTSGSLKINEFHIDSNVVATDPVKLNGYGVPLNANITVAGHTPFQADTPPEGAYLDNRYANSDPAAVFLLYKKCKRNNFKGLLPIFK